MVDNMSGREIKIYMPDGNPQGIRICDETNSVAKAFVIPRTKMDWAQSRKELTQPGVYLLISDEDEVGRPKVYIGESDNLIRRLSQHKSGKDFWNQAICFISEKGNLNKAHVKYLENYTYEQARKINECDIENDDTPTQTQITESERDHVLRFYDEIKILLGVLGYSFLEETQPKAISIKSVVAIKSNVQIVPAQTQSIQTAVFYCKKSGADAMGVLKGENKFVVYADSKAVINNNPLYARCKELQTNLQQKGVLEPDGNNLIFRQDFTFNSPSAASMVVLGHNANGWVEWKTKQGITLDEIGRKTSA